NPEEALVRYQNERIAAMNDMIIRNRNFGLEAVLQLTEERAPGGFADIADVLTREELESTAVNFKKAAGLDLETVNNRESLAEPDQRRAEKSVRGAESQQRQRVGEGGNTGRDDVTEDEGAVRAQQPVKQREQRMQLARREILRDRMQHHRVDRIRVKLRDILR